MKKYAFIVSPINTHQLKKLWPACRFLPSLLINILSRALPRLKVLRVKDVRSNQGKNIQGFLIISSLLSQQLSSLSREELVFDRVISAGHLAKELGAKIAGLDCFAALVADKGYATIVKSLKIPVTSGHALTAWSVFEGVYRIAKARKIDLKHSHIAIIGAASTAIGLAARKLSDYVAKVTLTDKEIAKMVKLKDLILTHADIEVVIENDAGRAVKDADIVIKSSCPEESPADFNLQNLKAGCIFCHIPSFYNGFERSRLRDDIAFAQLGLIKLPFKQHIGIFAGLPRGTIYASLAETMLLALEEKFVNYSLGDYINLDKLEEIADLAVQHGFEVWVPEAPVL
ncbi:MAG: hypothetical protein AMJ95_00490 [Omnitrophica WOR_2 bacterium SM23_72]|nr:MAG: hypothetical protein AMJ95_00490 [Omnitrophica WOR_2 bacterium SM23_72]